MLLARIDAHLRRTRLPVTRFGRDAVGDPNFVLDLRDGRMPRDSTVKRVLAFIEACERAAADDEGT
jgi:hypothetical protein